MTSTFDALPVALPPGCEGVRVRVSTVTTLVQDAGTTRRADFLAGRLAAAEAMRLLGLEPGGVLGRQPDGAPAWPDGVRGSISHHSGVACAVASRDASGMGVDIAPLLSESQVRAVARRCLVDAERETWRSPHEIAVVFAAKEAIYKAAYPRAARYIGFEEAHVIAQVDGQWTARLGPRLSADIGVGWVSGTFAWESDLVYTALALGGGAEHAG